MKPVLARLVALTVVLTPFARANAAVTPETAETTEKPPKSTTVAPNGTRPTRLPVKPQNPKFNAGNQHGPVKPVPTAHLPRGVSPSVKNGSTPESGEPKKHEDGTPKP